MTESRSDGRGEAADKKEAGQGTGGATLGWRPARFAYRSPREPDPVRPDPPAEDRRAADPESSPPEPSSAPPNSGKIL